MSDAQAAGNGEGQAQQSGADLSGITSQLEALTGSQEQLREFLQSEPWKPQEVEAAAEDDGLDLSFLSEGYEDPSTPDPVNLAEQLQAAVKKEIESATKPLKEAYDHRIAQIERQREADALVAEFPDLGDEETARQVVGTARELAEALGQPALADEPKFWRIAYMMGRAVDTANREGAEPPRAAHLEGGGGATPAGSQVDPGDLIVNAAQGGRRVLPF